MKTIILPVIASSFVLVSILIPHAFGDISSYDIYPKGYYANSTAMTQLTHNGATLIINQTVNKLEYRIGEKIIVHPEMINIGNSPAYIVNGMPLFHIEAVYQNSSISYDSGLSGMLIAGWRFMLNPGMAINDTGTWGIPQKTTPIIKLNVPGKYEIFSESNFRIYDNEEQLRQGLNYHEESLWSKLLQITVIPEKYNENETNPSFSKIPEFSFAIPVLLISILSLIIFYRVKFI